MGDQATNSTKLLYILIITSLGIGGVGAYNSTDNDSRVTKLVDNLDTVLQREMRLLTEPIQVTLHHVVSKQENLRDRLNDIERELAMLQGQFDEYKRMHP